MLLLLLSCSLGEPEEPRWLRGSPNPQDPPLDPAAPPPGSQLWCGALQGRPGWVWFAFDDRRCDEGRSVSSLERLEDAPPGLGCGVRWKGRKEEGFAGAGAELQGLNLRTTQQLRLAMRGDGQRYRLGLPMRGQVGRSTEEPESCTSKRFDFYGKELRCGDGTDTWIEVVIPLTGLQQEGWGEVWDWKADDVLQLQVQAIEKGSFQCDFRLVAVEDG